MKITIHIIVNTVANMRSGITCSPYPIMIGIGPNKRIMPRDPVKPERRAVNTRMSTPANINMKLRRNSFMDSGIWSIS